MVKISIEKFTEQAIKSGKFDPQWTVSKVRAGRKGNIVYDPILQEDTINDNIEDDDITITDLGGDIILENIENNNAITIKLPDSLEKINLLINILNKNSGADYIIIVNNKEYPITTQGMKLLEIFK